MVPCMAVLRCCEVVDVLVSARDWTLGDAVDAVHLIGAQLSDAMPMDRRAVVAVVVLHVDDDLVTPAGLDCWSWVSAIEGDPV